MSSKTQTFPKKISWAIIVKLKNVKTSIKSLCNLIMKQQRSLNNEFKLFVS